MPQPPRPTQAEHFARLLLASMPDDVRKSIGRAELNDRLVYAAELAARVSNPALSPKQRMDAKAEALLVMKAAPRAVTEQLVADKVAKAARLGDSPQADVLRRQARELLEQNPPAPRRTGTVRKARAKADNDLVPVFDESGRLCGVASAADIMPLGGKKDAPPADPQEPPAQPQAVPSAPDAQVTKALRAAGKVVVFDQWQRPYMTDPGRVFANVAKAAHRGMVRVTDDDGNTFWADPAALRGPASAEAQARNTGPVNAGGTTGMGAARMTGPASALPGDGPQKALPGDVPGRQVVKSSLGLPVRTVGEAARERRLAQVAKETGRDFRGRHMFARNPYAGDGSCVCEAPAGHAVHTAIAPGQPVPAGARRVAKAADWRPALRNEATARWLAAQRRR